MVKVFYVRIPGHLDENLFFNLSTQVSGERQKAISRFKRYEDKLRSLCAELLLRYACENITGYPFIEKEFQIDKNEFGKPYFSGKSEYHFNLSHSGDYVICGISDYEIGVDIEKHGKMETDIARRHFASGEYLSILSQKPENRMQHFFDIWTLKESYIKAVGGGLAIPLNSFEIVFSGREVDIYRGEAIDPDYSILQINDIDDHYSGAVCIKGKNKECNSFSLIEVDFLKFK